EGGEKVTGQTRGALRAAVPSSLHSRLFLEVADTDVGFFAGGNDFRLVRHARFLAEALQLVELFLGRPVIHGITHAVWPGSTCFGVFFSRCGVIFAGLSFPGMPSGARCSRCRSSSKKSGSRPLIGSVGMGHLAEAATHRQTVTFLPGGTD